MSDTQQKLPLSAVIFDRTHNGEPDAPTFSKIYQERLAKKQKAAQSSVPPADQVIPVNSEQSSTLEHASFVHNVIDVLVPSISPHSRSQNDPTDRVLSSTTVPIHEVSKESTVMSSDVIGDSTTMSGQTHQVEFPMTSEQAQTESVQEYRFVAPQSILTPPNPYAFLREDPVLYRSTISSDALVSFLSSAPVRLHSQQISVQASVPVISIPSLTNSLLDPQHHAGLFDIAVIPSGKLQGKLLEEQRYALKRLLFRLERQTTDLIAHLASGQLRNQVGTSISWAGLAFIRKSEYLLSGVWQTIRSIVRTLNTAGKSIGSAVSAVRFPLTAVPQFTVKKPRLTLPSAHLFLPTLSVDDGSLGSLHRRVGEKLSLLRSLLREYVANLPSFPRIASTVMLSLSIVLMLMTAGPIVVLEGRSIQQRVMNSLSGRAEDATTLARQQEQAKVVPTSSPVATATPDPVPTPDKLFQLQIPKIGADMKVIANVDPGSEKEYVAALEQGVAHAKGTNLPGENSHTKTVYIFGHSTDGSWNIARFNALFYNLKDLEAGDSIKLWFWGKDYNYTVTEKKILDPNDVSYLQPQTDKDQLVLQTCWPPGTTWKRLLVIAEPNK